MEAMRTPNSEEVQNATYVDEMTGYTNAVNSAYDSVRTEATECDVPLSDFLSRPVRIYNHLWTLNSPVLESFDPWKLFLNDKRVANRLNNFKLLQAKLHVKFVVNGTPFHYGRMLCSYFPMGYFDDFIPLSFNDVDLIINSQKMHVLLNPSDNEGAELVLPMFWWKNAISTTNEAGAIDDFSKMGSILMRTMNALQHANGGSDSANIAVYAWAEDVRMHVPTQRNLSGLIPQSTEMRLPNSDEYHNGPVSGVASALANLSGKLTPYIGRYARATQVGMQAAGKIASLFGFSRPANLEYQQYRPVPKGNLAIYNLPDDVTKLSMDAKQELTVDPNVFGGSSGGDEMDILKIAQVESYIGQFPFNNGTPQEERLFTCLVDPSLASTTTGGFLAMPAITYAATPFKYWRGSIKYRFQVVCSRYHKGRIKVVYDPCVTTQNAEYNTAFTTVVDFSDTTDFTVVCGWGQANTYREVQPLGLFAPPYATGLAPLFYDPEEETFGNGMISVYCVNDVASPAADTNIAINVYVSAGDDFELAVPDATYVSRLRVSNDIETSPGPNRTPNSTEVPTAATSSVTVPGDAPEVSTDGNIMPFTDAANLVHFGESMRSFRQLIKRYCLHEMMPIPVANEPSFTQFQRTALPFIPGYTDHGSGGNLVPASVSVPAGAAGYAYGNMTFLRYVTLGFAGWRGGIRYTVDFSNYPCCNLGSVKATRYTSCVPESVLTPKLPHNTTGGRAQAVRLNKETTGGEGIVLCAPRVNPVLSFELPFYSQYRFMPSRLLDYFGGDQGLQLPQPCWKLAVNSMRTDITGENPEFNALLAGTIDTYVAAAEDFNVAWYQGPPLFWLEGAPPTS